MGLVSALKVNYMGIIANLTLILAFDGGCMGIFICEEANLIFTVRSTCNGFDE